MVMLILVVILRPRAGKATSQPSVRIISGSATVDVAKNPGSNQCQLIPGEVTKSNTVDKTTKPQQIRNTDELKITVEHIPDGPG
jgi:hypothetical protein